MDLTRPTKIAKPIISTIYTADPSAVVGQDGVLYIYASHDMDPPAGCDRMDRYHIFSTVDMVHFRDEGEILRSDDVPWGRPEGGFMWAPDCGFKNGKYYFYYPHPTDSHWNDSWVFGVAVSDHPHKDFRDIGYVKMADGAKVGGWCMIDPCIFTDDDGVTYFYFGGGAMPRGCRLQEDMLTVDGDVYEMEGLHDFHEAAWVFKRNGIYYMTYSDNLEGNNRLCYATSQSPLGPWDYKGIYLAPTGCDTSHGSVVEYKGHWYAFYHNCSISGRGNLRSVCVDELFFEGNGDIRLVEQTATPCAAVDAPPVRDARTKTYTAPLCEEHGVRYTKVEGFGGRAQLHIAHGERAHTRVRLVVNAVDWSYINLLPDETARFTVPLKAGCTNTVELRWCDGKADITALTVEPIE
ncbi:MAG: glycosyl hydrolase family 43 [Ruminococcaceae bacterium]|nr:glycosyl hydrolase family 43 [Oscillospiraceae bacterium]